jgi:hypothetical protein
MLVACCASRSTPAAACALLAQRANGAADSSAALTECLKSLPAGARLALAPGLYRLSRPVRIPKPVTIATRGISKDEPGCAELTRGRCAPLLLDIGGPSGEPSRMPIEITGDGVTLAHLVIRGAGSATRPRSFCLSESLRPLGGGIRLSGSGFTMRKSVLRDMTCYSALEITSGADEATLAGNVIGPNGDHGTDQMWSDGVTIHDSAGTNVTGNRFVDNTDVQLIFGGCRDCRIEGNEFRHSDAFSSGSFAELMLQSWPGTSGDFRGTLVEHNRIDCGPRRRCGYGIMIGSAPWYQGRASGGTVAQNRIEDAMIAINIDSLSGPATVRDNQVRSSGGRFDSDCGYRDWPQVNVSPASRSLVRGNVADVRWRSVTTAKYLLNRHER